MTNEERRALARAYRESRRPMGVYRVRSVATGRWLVGSSVDLPSILNRHRAQLRLGVHPDAAFQAEWNRLGPEALAFEVLDTLDPPETPGYDPGEDLRALEALWRETLRAEEAASAE